MNDQIELHACLDYYLCTMVIPQFHSTKLINFTNIVREMANTEASNNSFCAMFWSKVSADC